MSIKALLHRSVRVALAAAGIGALLLVNPQLAEARPPEGMRELNLSRSQMRQLRDIMQDYQSDLQGILSPEQLEEMQDLREAQQNGEVADVDREDMIAELGLSDNQVEQLDDVQASLEAELEGVLTSEQLEKLSEMEGFSGI
ncbi:MAG: hypothetical protein AAFX01_14105 [Cyanobacteria bacterium J06638_28]